MPRVFNACFTTTYTFKVPTNIFLLDEDDEMNNPNRDGVIGSWWIRQGMFYYIDKDGKTQEIDYNHSYEENRPDNVEEDDPESDDEDDNSDCEKDGYENECDDFNLRSDKVDAEEVKPVIKYVGCIIDCPAARAMEAAGLAELEEERVATEEKEALENVWKAGYDKGFKDGQDEWVPIKRDDILARFHLAFQKLKNDATLMRDAPWPSMSIEERKNLCPTLHHLINTSEILY